MMRTLPLLALIACVHPASAQQRDPSAADAVVKAKVLEDVMHYRVTFMNDPSKFTGCSVIQELAQETPERLLAPFYVGLLSVKRCPQGGSPMDAPVMLRSIVVADTTATAELLVQHGEYVHMETFSLVRRGVGWTVREVRLWGASYVDVRPPGDRQPPAPPR